MANEYLKRTPTSTGNRKVWTLSLWLKRNAVFGDTGADAIFNAANTASNSHGTDIRFRKDNSNGNNNGWNFYDYNANAFTWVKYGDTERRDSGNWFHAMFVFDSTKPRGDDRVEVYINGVLDTAIMSSYDTNPSANYETYVNSITEHYLGVDQFAGSLTTSYSKSEFSDVFLVDGQALTPDVFGFYKEGKGYQSSGTQRATDFRPGQWSPKAPRTIKSEINRKGGFGVNGFYLPMNDSSNVGADFHCDIDSIIKLKGEDLPQPRNGAPTTTDSYVSQLRTDAYASNLVLAIPGIIGGQGNGYGDYSADIKGSGSNKTITANGNAGVAVTASYYGSAMQFDGTGDYFSVPNSSDLRFTTEDFTIEAWFNTNSLTDNQFIFSQWNVTDNRRSYVLWLDSGVLKFNGSTNGSDSSNGNVTNTISVGAGQWNHAAFSREGTTTRLFLNGVCIGISTTTDTYYNNTDDTPRIGGESGSGAREFDGYIQDLRVYKGVAKYTSGFDVPKPYAPVGIGTWRVVSDTCKNNFATLNSVSGNESSGQFTFSDGNLTASTTGSNKSFTCNVGMSTGKWYWEYSPNIIIGFHDIGISSLTNPPDGFDDGATSASWRTSTGQIRQGNTNVQATGLSASAGDIVQIAFNADTRKMWVGVNGSYYNNGDPAAGTDSTYQTNLTADTYFFSASLHQSGSTDNHSGIANFGQNPTFSGNVSAASTQRNADSNGKGEFRYEPPTGFLALCEDNLPTPAIADPGEHFKTVLYTGDGNEGHSITGVGFKPDLVWIKCRSHADNHTISDTVRGPGLALYPDLTNSEHASTIRIQSFNDDGFTTGSSGDTNTSGRTFCAWCWKAGGPAVENTEGSITSQVSVNQTAGFSIVSYTGTGANATVGHGLDKTPNIVLCKTRPDATNWSFNGNVAGLIYGSNKMVLQATDAIIADTNEVMSANATTFSIGNSTATNGTADAMIAYCWYEVEGFSKFGSYIGNGNADGPFVYCGFKPAWLMVKNTNSSEPWAIYDSSRGSINPNSKGLYADDSAAENDASGRYKDFVSNGFKIRGTSGEQNSDGSTYFFMAFAESPFQTANAK